MPLYAPFWGSKSPGGSLIRKYLNTKRREKQYCSLTSNNVNVRWASVIEENDQESWRRNKLIVKGLRTNFHHFNVPCPLLTRWRQFLWGLRSHKFPPQIDSSLHKIHLTSEFMTPSKTRWYIYCMVNKKKSSTYSEKCLRTSSMTWRELVLGGGMDYYAHPWDSFHPQPGFIIVQEISKWEWWRANILELQSVFFVEGLQKFMSSYHSRLKVVIKPSEKQDKQIQRSNFSNQSWLVHRQSRHRPPRTPKQVTWQHWTCKISSTAFQIIRRPIKCRCWSCGTSYPSPFTPWDPLGLPLDPVRPCRPTPWSFGTLKTYPLTSWDPVALPLNPLGPCRPTPWPPGTL